MILKNSLNIFLKFVLSVFMCFFIALSCNIIFSFAFSEETGYDVFALNEETGKNEFLYHYDSDSGEDTLYSSYEAEGIKLKKEKTVELSRFYNNMAHTVSMIISLMFIVGTTYNTLWEMGNRDISRVHNGTVKENKLYGLYYGLIAAIPSFLLYIVLILSRLSVLKPEFLSVFRLFNSHFYGLITLIYADAVNSTELSILQMAGLFVTVIFLPVVCSIGYYIGYKDIRISRNLIYKKKN